MLKVLSYIVGALLVVATLYVGIKKSDFSNLKKQDTKFGTAKGSNPYYSTAVRIDSNTQYATLGDFTINVSDNQMMIASISVRCEDECPYELEENGPVVRNAVIRTIDMVARDNRAVQNNNASQDYLKDSIKNSLNSLSKNTDIKEVFFTKLIYQ